MQSFVRPSPYRECQTMSVWQFQSEKQWLAQCSSWIFNHNGPRQKCLQVPYTHTHTNAHREIRTVCLICEWTVCSLELPPGWDCVLSSFAHLFASMGPLFNFNYMNLNCALRLAPLATLCVRPSSNQAYDKLIANVYTDEGRHTHTHSVFACVYVWHLLQWNCFP